MSTDKSDQSTDASRLDLSRLIKRVSEALHLRRMSAREASRKAGFNVGYVGDLLSGRSKAPDLERIIKLADALELEPGALLSEAALSQEVAHHGRVAVAAKSRHTADVDIPLYSARLAVTSRFLPVAPSVIGSTKPVPQLAGDADAYAFLVPNDSNAPRYFAGELVYVSPVSPVTAGEFAYARLADGRTSIARVAEMSADTVRLEWIADSAEETFPADKIAVLHRIVASGS